MNKQKSKKSHQDAKKQHRIIIVDDHPVFRQGIRQLIDGENDLTVCCEVETGSEAIAGVEKHKPDLAIVDIALKGTNGIELVKSLKALEPNLPALVLSMHDESLYAERALRAGARGYVMKQEPCERVITAIRKVLAGQLYVSSSIGTQMIRKFVEGTDSAKGSSVDALSDRELEVLQWIGRGNGTRQIAERLNLSVKTVESHRAHIKEKLNFKTAPEMVRFAVEWVGQQPC